MDDVIWEREFRNQYGRKETAAVVENWPPYWIGTPIENLFMAGLILNFLGRGIVVLEDCWASIISSKPPKAKATNFNSGVAATGGKILVMPQFRAGRYRVDFLIDYIPRAAERWSEITSAVIECDGHDFHERTKEQAEADKRRDRVLQSHGASVLRFSGREIVRDPLLCAANVLWHLDVRHRSMH